MQWQAEHFWSYSLRLYDMPDVAPQLLQLQDRYGLNINDVLLVLYLAESELMVSAAQWRVMRKATQSARQQTQSIRTLRRAAKGTDDYERLKTLELDSEKQQQQALLAHLSDLSVMPLSSPLNGLIACASATKVSVEPGLNEALINLLVAVNDEARQ
ncbi:TIGR02444 family protein [Aestuariibacter halophilus]|uniref:TIGR02444 family protein n=1 Tax=Fluctibacter halophilus TaxID=226011 RepID=A0ABS8GA24_9ALTE|nr:TIGR02444 family protein [Aestuariibacter halophilus]MCC2617036.1 TIGR02444 family protein [Aestuariibacter halophilus]